MGWGTGDSQSSTSHRRVHSPWHRPTGAGSPLITASCTTPPICGPRSSVQIRTCAGAATLTPKFCSKQSRSGASPKPSSAATECSRWRSGIAASGACGWCATASVSSLCIGQGCPAAAFCSAPSCARSAAARNSMPGSIPKPSAPICGPRASLPLTRSTRIRTSFCQAICCVRKRERNRRSPATGICARSPWTDNAELRAAAKKSLRKSLRACLPMRSCGKWCPTCRWERSCPGASIHRSLSL